MNRFFFQTEIMCQFRQPRLGTLATFAWLLTLSFGSLTDLSASFTIQEGQLTTVGEPALAPEARLEGSIERLDPRLDELIDAEQKVEILGDGFQWSEGPVWIPADALQNRETGYLLFSDVPRNTMHRWTPQDGVTVFMQPSQFDGDRAGDNEGSNGLMLDQGGDLLVCDHGDRCIYRVNEIGEKSLVASKFDDRRFNSPNDLILDSAGNIYFTDPPYGLKATDQRELDFCGIFKRDLTGKISLISDELQRPNGIALSPDENQLYVAQSFDQAMIYQVYQRDDKGNFSRPGKILYDATPLGVAGGQGLPDGLAVDIQGNLWATGPGGVLIIHPDGTLLGRILLPQATANCCFGEEDGATLFITSKDKLGRIKTLTRGLQPQ